VSPPARLSADDRLFLARAIVPLHLSVLDEGGWPRSVSLWFVERDGDLWCATQGTARVVRYLRADERCSFEVSTQTMPYRGVRGRANAAIEEEGAAEVLRDLIDRYLGTQDSAFAAWLLSRADEEVAIRVRPQQLSRWDFSSRMSTS
jgi:nitroimidazol reductase NimA-like FMN-containing flavoprotein (pyridoxamine 5'-phosphate oxidase superfamily)